MCEIIKNQRLNRLDRIMTEKNISGKELSILSGLSESEISNIRHCIKSPTHNVALKIGKALDMKLEEIFETDWKNVKFM